MSVLWSIGEDSDVGSARSSGREEGGMRELRLSIWGVTVRRTIPNQRAEVDLNFTEALRNLCRLQPPPSYSFLTPPRVPLLSARCLN
jgi:hypothetical protein